jgi:hypothetical protein
MTLVLLVAGRASAATPEDLEHARVLFTQALADQDAGRTDAALEKYRRVAEVRDTSQVEYRIASCLEALGQKRAALVAYDRSAHLGRGEAQAGDVVTAANEHITTLAASMGKLAITVRGGTSPLIGASASQLTVRIDGEVISHEEAEAEIVLEPGPHTVDVSAPAMKPTRASVTIVQGRRADLALALEPEPVVVPPPSRSYARRNVGVGLLVGAGALAIGYGVTLFVRQNVIDTIKSDCPNDTCPVSLHDSIESMRSTATTLMPVAIALGAAAIILGGTGIVFVALGPTVGIRGTF